MLWSCLLSLIHHAHSFHLGIGTNGASALSTGVGTELIEALGAHVFFILLHILLPVQVVAAVVAVEAVSHGGGEIALGTCGEKHKRLSDSGLCRASVLLSRGDIPGDTRWGQCCLL